MDVDPSIHFVLTTVSSSYAREVTIISGEKSYAGFGIMVTGIVSFQTLPIGRHRDLLPNTIHESQRPATLAFGGLISDSCPDATCTMLISLEPRA